MERVLHIVDTARAAAAGHTAARAAAARHTGTQMPGGLRGRVVGNPEQRRMAHRSEERHMPWL